MNLTRLRELAKRLKTQHELALQLWATGNTAARLLATLVCTPKALSRAELDAMIRDIRAPKLTESIAPEPSRSVSASLFSSATQHRPAAHRPMPLCGSPRWCDDARASEAVGALEKSAVN